jgi:hypothetical protein
MGKPDQSLPVKADAIVRTAVIEAVARWASTSDVQPHIRQVLFDVTKVVATDGHRLVEVPCPEVIRRFGVERAHLLTAVAAQRALPGPLRSDLEFRLIGETVHIRIASKVDLVVPSANAADFPPYETVLKVTPSATSPTGYIFDANYLAAIEEVDDATCGKRGGLEVLGWGDDKTSAMIFKNSVGCRFAVMPMRRLLSQEDRSPTGKG